MRALQFSMHHVRDCAGPPDVVVARVHVVREVGGAVADGGHVSLVTGELRGTGVEGAAGEFSPLLPSQIGRPYTSRPSEPPPFAVMGRHHEEFLWTSASIAGSASEIEGYKPSFIGPSRDGKTPEYVHDSRL